MFNRVRNSIQYRTGLRFERRPPARRFPETAEELERDELYRSWWYYSVELLPGLVARGVYPADLPMLPRLMLRRCKLAGTACLDIGTMEGIMPVLMRRGGAAEVQAIDAVDHCSSKLEAIRHYYGVDFAYQSVGLMYELDKKLRGRGFDVVNCSGLLYHVFSPLMVLCGVRPLLKRNGLMIVSTNVTLTDEFAMEFNNAGRLQAETNTFWYVSVKLLDYMLRYLRLAPVDCLFLPHEMIRSDVKYVFDKPSGYLSVLCRAADEVLPTRGDGWMAQSAKESWEYQWVPDWAMADAQPISSVELNAPPDRRYFRQDVDCLDLWEAVRHIEPTARAERPADSHTLMLTDKS